MLSYATCEVPVQKPRPSRSASVVALALLAACADGTGPSHGPPPLLTALPRPLTAAESSIAEAVNAFSFNLLTAAQSQTPEATVFLSPLSASMALGMTMNGAAGNTFDQMRGSLGFGSLPQQDINVGYKGLLELLAALDATSDMKVANSIWAAEGVPFVPAFLGAGRDWFDAEVQSVDFDDPATLVLVNDWVKTKTGGKIPKLLDRFDDDVVMALINAIYFKGAWRVPFDPKRTSAGTFRGTQGNQSAQMMRRSGEFLVSGHANYTAAELLYGNGAFAMTLVLPREGMTVRELTASLTPTAWTNLVTGMAEAGNAELVMPKFRLDYTRLMNEDLKFLGMTDAFSEQLADFSRLVVPPPQLMISSVLQKTFLDVNEEGTTAAAATVVQIGPTSAPPSYQFDRPFLLVLRERLSGTILFLGQITHITPAS